MNAPSSIVAESPHLPHVAHHFESPEQQFDAGKLGMWIFLITEVLFFSGLFVTYAVYRSNHPEVFQYAHLFLNKTPGALNTLVLLLSSLTMAWSIRCAQLNQQRGLIACLASTLACAGFFLGVKAYEYSTKWNEGLLWAGDFHPHLEHPAGVLPPALLALCAPAAVVLVAGGTAWCCLRQRISRAWSVLTTTLSGAALAFLLGAAAAVAVAVFQPPHPPAVHVAASQDASAVTMATTSEPPRLAGVFFSIYYAMTGVHAIHIVAGMGAIGWLLYRAAAGDFHSQYFAPVDYVGLYWHLVDLVWIYLFPLLYLIR